MIRKYLYLLLPFFLLQSCVFLQSEIDRIEIEELSIEELRIFEGSELTLQEGDNLHLWSKFDIVYKNDPGLLLQVQILNDKDEILLLMEMNPLNVDTRIMCFKETKNEITDYSCEGRIDDYYRPDDTDHIEIAEDGIYKFKAVLSAFEENIIEFRNCYLIIKK